MLGISAETSEQLLLHQFLTGLPHEVSKPLRATRATTTLKTAVEQAKLIMAVEQHTPVAATQSPPSNEFHQLQQQISELTAQVAALSTQQSRRRTTPLVAPSAFFVIELATYNTTVQHSRPQILFHLWSARPWLENLSTGKWTEGNCLW